MNWGTSGSGAGKCLKKKKKRIERQLAFNYRGYSLAHAIATMVLLSLFSITILTYMNFNTNLVQGSLKSNLGRTYCIQAFNLLSDKNIQHGKYYSWNIDDVYKLSFKKDFWGVYEHYTSIVCNNGDTLQAKTALVGISKDSTDKTTLLLSNSTSVFSVADNVFIYGDCYVPKGISKRYAGSLRNSNIPEVLYKSPDTISTLIDVDLVTNSLLAQAGSIAIHKKTLELNNTIHNSFMNEPLVISADTIHITGTLLGKIILRANTIIVDSSSTITGPILVGKSVVFNRNSKGSMQVFVTENLLIEEDVYFNYPSIIFFFPELDTVNNSINSTVVVKDRCSFFGDIYITKQKKNTKIQFDNVRMLTGSIYSMEDISFNGKCSGPMILKNLINYKYSVVQKNLADNLTINIDSLPDYYTFSSISYLGIDKKIVQWCD